MTPLLKYIPFLGKLSGWKVWAILAALAFAGGFYAGDRWSDAGYYKAAVDQLKTALNEAEIAKQNQIESVKKVTNEKTRIRQESDRLRKQLRNITDAKDCANQPIGDDISKLLQP